MKQRISLKDVEIAIDDKVVGAADSCSVTLTRANTVAYEGATYLPAEIVGGHFAISGSLSRAWVDNELLNQLMPNRAVPPSFTLKGKVVSGKSPDRTFTILGAVFKDVDINSLTLDGFAKNKMDWDATGWRFD